MVGKEVEKNLCLTDSLLAQCLGRVWAVQKLS